MQFRNIDMKPLKNPSNFRKLCMGNWNDIGDPQVYGLLELDCEQIIPYIEKLREEHGVKVTINHLVGRVMGLVLKQFPQINGLIANGRIYLREKVNVFFQVGLEDAETELAGICVRDVDQKGIVEVAQAVINKSQKLRASKDHHMRKSQSSFKHMPWRLIPHVIKFLNWLQFDWNLNIPKLLGSPRDPLGSIMITSIGSLGIEYAFVPLTHIGRTPLQVAVGKIHKKAVVVEHEDGDKIEIRRRVNICFTFDHRFMDGMMAGKIIKYIKNIFENVESNMELLEAKDISNKEDKANEDINKCNSNEDVDE